MERLWRLLRAVTVVFWMLGLCGCYPAYGRISAAVSGGGDADPFDGSPQMRTGALLFPAAIWPLNIADPSDLGQHAHAMGPLPAARLEETSSGLIYTRRAGFVDVAHLRNTIDLAFYARMNVRDALREHDDHIVLYGAEPSLYHVDLTYPDWWDGLTPSDREQLIDELSIRLGQRMGYIMMTWHEIITWHGYKATLVVSEKWSAFSCDDVASHVIGAAVAGKAMRDDRPFDEAVTHHLAAVLRDLEALEPAQTSKRIQQVKGDWWTPSGPDLLRRQTDVHLAGEDFTPWLVPGELAEPFTARLPSLEEVEGRDCRDVMRVRIQPNITEAGRIYRDLNTKPRQILPDKDFPRLVDAIRRGAR